MLAKRFAPAPVVMPAPIVVSPFITPKILHMATPVRDHDRPTVPIGNERAELSVGRRDKGSTGDTYGYASCKKGTHGSCLSEVAHNQNGEPATLVPISNICTTMAVPWQRCGILKAL